MLLSWITFTNAQTLGGDLTWIKPPSDAHYYPLGFSRTAVAIGSRYYLPGKATNVLGQTSTPLTLTLEGGNLGQGPDEAVYSQCQKRGRGREWQKGEFGLHAGYRPV